MTDYTAHVYPSRRMTTFGRRGMVCASQPLAAQAGLDALKAGGNAVDAALATAIALTVVEPTSNGIGGDAFALVWSGGKLHGLNASGPAPMAIDVEALGSGGKTQLPKRGWAPVTVPGQVAGWEALSRAFGRLPFARLFEPAIGYAREGFPLSPVVSIQWEEAFAEFSRLAGEAPFAHWQRVFAPRGRAPKAGELWKSPLHAETLELLAGEGTDAFYRGTLARQIDEASRAQGGFLRYSDLETYQPQWVEPISVDYRGHKVWEIPPNGHGLVALMALGILEGLELEGFAGGVSAHRQIEAMKLAFADGKTYITDPNHMQVAVEQLLSPRYLAERRALIGEQALFPAAGDPRSGGTVYLCAADGEGNMVSYIQSNYADFGSGIVVPGTGISLHNRGCNFALEPGHHNCLAPGKKTYHTIIPGFLTKGDEAVGPFGVMGAFMQPQGHVQVVNNLLDFSMNPQQALDAPRWQWIGGMAVEVEPGYPKETAKELERRGHHVIIAKNDLHFGRGQMILRLPDGVLAGASEPRADGAAAAW